MYANGRISPANLSLYVIPCLGSIFATPAYGSGVAKSIVALAHSEDLLPRALLTGCKKRKSRIAGKRKSGGAER
jgi:hypothetical protein